METTLNPHVCFKVEKILGVSSEGSYQVQWAPSWVSRFHLVGCENLIQEFLQERTERENYLRSAVTEEGFEGNDDAQYEEANESVEREIDIGRSMQSCVMEDGDEYSQVESSIKIEVDTTPACEYSQNSVVSDVQNAAMAEHLNQELTSFEKGNAEESTEYEPNSLTQFSDTEVIPMMPNFDEHFGVSLDDKESMIDSYELQVPGNESGVSTGSNTSMMYQRRNFRQEVSEDDVKEHPQSMLMKDSAQHISEDRFTFLHDSQFPNSIPHFEPLKSYSGNNKQYLCKKCGASFTQEGNLKRHLMTNHSSAKPYTCETCQKAFSRSDAYKRHSRTHLNKKHFSQTTPSK